ncbi:hypothetical protein JCM11641_005653 [Rhodosporidiobolus odoratus]
MAAPARTAAQATRSLATQAIAPARPRRLNKRTARSSPSAVLSSLTELYHLTPTFVPTSDPSTLSQHITSTLVQTSGAIRPKPKPYNLHELISSQTKVDVQRIRLEASGSATTSILGLDLKQPGNGSQATLGSAFENEGFDHRESFFTAFTKGAEPPLARRMRRMVDKLHGTEAGGRAGVETMKEFGDKAKEWREGLGKARFEQREMEKRMEREAEEFVRAFEGEQEGEARDVRA